MCYKESMTGKILIFYSFKKLDPGKRKQFDRKLFGTIEKTHKGKYEARTVGILTGKKYRKPIKSAIITEKENLKSISILLDEFSAKKEIYKIAPL